MADNGLKSVYVSKAKQFQHIILLLNSDKFNRGNIHAYVFTAHSPYIRALTSLGQALCVLGGWGYWERAWDIIMNDMAEV